MKKGFTLVELVATVALLGILLLFSYSKVSDIAERKNKELLDNKKTLVINAAKDYINNSNDLSQNIGDIHCIEIEELEDENLVPIDVEDLKKKYNFVKIIICSKNSYNLVNYSDKSTCESR